jgi:hypothetical protein
MKTRAVAAALLPLLSAIFAILSVASARAGVVLETSQGCARPASSVAVTHRAGLVVTFGDRSTKTFCIEFSADTISGLELLQRSGLTLVTSGTGGLGAAVCSIDGEGSSDPTNCFASCSSGTCAYWAYYRFVSGAWQFSQAGASQTAVHDGDVQGWAWGPGGTSTGAVPAPPGEICPPISPTPTPTWTPVPPAPAMTPVASQTQPTALATTAASDHPAVVTSIPTTTDVSPPPPATDEPSPAPAAPAPSRQNAVEGEVRSPGRDTTTASAATPTPIATPKSGAIVIGENQGIQNQARSQSRTAGTGGSRTSLVVFSILAGLLAAAAAAILYRRRRAV